MEPFDDRQRLLRVAIPDQALDVAGQQSPPGIVSIVLRQVQRHADCVPR
jgi:hypothetical protein